MNPKHLRLLSCAVLCFGVAAVLFFGFESSGGRIIAWALLPYLFAFVAALLPQGRVGASGVLFGCALVALGGAWAYHDTIYVHPDAQGALVFVFPPLWQLVGSIVLLALAWVASFVSVLRDTTRAA